MSTPYFLKLRVLAADTRGMDIGKPEAYEAMAVPLGLVVAVEPREVREALHLQKHLIRTDVYLYAPHPQRGSHLCCMETLEEIEAQINGRPVLKVNVDRVGGEIPDVGESNAASPGTNVMLQTLVGLLEAEAVELLESRGFHAHISQRDNERFVGTANVDFTRVKLRVTDGRVTWANLG